jgi:hypothetical protein
LNVIRVLVAAMICLLLLPAPASAQRRRKTPAKKKPVAAAPVVDAAVTERREAAKRIADQVKSLSHFLYLLGGVTKTVQAADEASQGPQVSPDVIRATERSKATVREAIHNVQIGLDQLESDFSAKSSLRPYYHLLIGATDIAATANQQADAGQFDQAGRSLLKALDKLTDVLVAMQATP